MREMNVFKALCSSFCCIIVTLCVKYNAEPFADKALPRTCGYSIGVMDDWVCFNLRIGERFNTPSPNQDITEGERKKRTDQDLVSCGYHLHINSGTNGIGQGAAVDLGYESYDEWETISQLPADPKWMIDNDTEVYITALQNNWSKCLVEHGLDFSESPQFDPNTGPAKALTSANPISAEVMSFADPPPVYTPSYRTYVIHAADDKRYFRM